MVRGAGGTEIGVDLKALDAFGADMGHYATTVVGTSCERIALVFADGAQFGMNTPSPDVHQAREAYGVCLDAINTHLFALVDAATALALAARSIASAYAHTDAAVTAAVEAAAQSLTPPTLRLERGELAR